MAPRSPLRHKRSRNKVRNSGPRCRLAVELLEDRTVLTNGLWLAAFGGLSSDVDLVNQAQVGRNHLASAGITEDQVKVIQALDLTGTFVLQTPVDVSLEAVTDQLDDVGGFVFVHDAEMQFNADQPPSFREEAPHKGRAEAVNGPFNYDLFVQLEQTGRLPDQGGTVDSDPANLLTNNGAGNTGTSGFTQSETSLVAFGNTVVIGFNDSGSNTGGTNKFTGWSRSTDGGATFVDGGTLPTTTNGDAGDPVLARHDASGTLYFSTLQFSGSGIQMFRSFDNGATWQAPVQAAPGKSGFQDKQWHVVDNYAGAGNGNVYLVVRDFGAGNGIYFFRSTNGGATFGPNGGTFIASGNQGAYVAVGPDHSVYAFWWAGSTVQMRKSTDFGLTFGAPVTVASGLVGGTNGDLNLVGQNNGEAFNRTIRSNSFPHVAVNPVSGHLYAVYNSDGPGVDKADVFMVMSTNGGATWTVPVKVNDDFTTTDQWQPTLAVTPDGSKLGIFYYSRQEDTTTADGDPVNNQFKYYGRIGNISGSSVTFGTSFAVSDTPSKPEVGRDSPVNTSYMGDYDQAVATPGAFHVIWSDSRSLLPGGGGRSDPNVYYKKISLGLTVASTTPAVGSSVSSVPLNYVVNFSEPIDALSVQASDFTVDGNPATSFVVDTSTQVTFSFAAAPFSAQGVHTMAMAGGSVTRFSDGDPLSAFSGPFLYDTVGLAVTTTVPPTPNGVFTLPGPFSYVVNFNEDITAGSVSPDDLTLTAGTVTGAVKSGFAQATYTISGITTQMPLTITIGAGKLTDSDGNPNPSSFVGTYQVDINTAPYPVPLAAKNPLGSLVYDPTITGLINTPGDIDNFTINVDPNQKITVFIDPASTLKGLIRLFDASNNLIGAATNATGLDAVIQTASTTGGTQTYRIEVSGDLGTTGTYTLGVILNAREEAERRNGPLNDTFATAEDINGSFIGLGGFASRGAVLGTAGGNDWYQFGANAGNTLTLALHSLTGGTVNVALYDPANVLLGVAVGGATNVSRMLNNFVAPVSGLYRALVTTATTGTLYNLTVLRNADFDREANDSFAGAQPIGGSDGALGHVAGGGSTLYTTGNDGNALIRINQATGLATTVGNFGFSQTWASAFTSDGILWTIVNGFNSAAARLATVNLTTGAATPVGSVNWTGSPIIALEGNTTGTLYAGNWAGTLFTVNKTTGQFTPVGSMGLFNVMDFTFDQSGTLWAVDGNNGLWRVNTTTGAGTFQATINGVNGMVMGIMVDPVDNSFYATTYTSNSPLYRVNPLTGVATQVGSGLGVPVPHGGDFAGSAQAGDWYSFAVNAGDSLNIFTSTPAGGTGEFVNTLNPKIELYLPSGSLVLPGTVLGDGRNEQILHTAGTSGLYRVLVIGEAGSAGEYFLSINGNTGTVQPPFQVTATNPVNGATLLTSPTTYTVDFNDAVLLASLQASDLKVNGVDAIGFSIVDGDTIAFALPGPLPNGTYTVAIAAGAIADVQGTPIQAFSATFNVDSIAPRVIATSLAPNAILTPGALSYQVAFSESMRALNLTSDDFLLRGNLRNLNYAPTSFSFNGAGTVVTLNYSNLPDDDYTLTLFSGATGGTNFTDAAGNALDGEFTGTFPSGNGISGGNFVIGFDMDLATEAYPALTPKNPLGSLVYDPTITRTIAFAGDVDELTLNLDPNQTITILVTPLTPGLQPRVELFNPSNVSLGFASAPAGQVTGIQTRSVLTGGIHKIQVSGLSGTQGLYSVQVILNAAFELEGKVVGATNSTPATAQSIDGSFLNLDTTLAHAKRGAVLGTVDSSGLTSTFANFNFETGAQGWTVQPITGTSLWHLSTRRGAQAGHSPTTSFYYGDEATGNYNFGLTSGAIVSPNIPLPGTGLLKVDFNYVLIVEGGTSWDIAELQISNNNGTTWTPLLTKANGLNSNATTWTAAPQVDVTAYAGQNVRFRFFFNSVDSAVNSTEGWYVDDVKISQVFPEDYYSFQVAAGERVSLALTNLTAGNVDVQLIASNGSTVLASGVAGATNLNEATPSVLITTAGTYYARVTGQNNVQYNLVVLKDAAFDAEGNNTAGTAQNVTGLQGALGHLESSQAFRVAVQQSVVNAAWTTAVVNQLNNDTFFNFTATAVTDAMIDTPAELANYDVVMFADYAAGISPTTAAALKTWVQAGLGGIVASSWINFNLKYYSTAPSTQSDLDVILPINMTSEFADLYSYSTLITNGAHPVTTGVVNFSGNVVGESHAGGVDVGATVLAVDEYNRPAIVVGSSGNGRGVYLHPSYMYGDGNTLTANADRLLEQAIAWASPLVGASDWYKVTLAAGETVLEVETRTPADGPGQFANTFNPRIELYDSTGTTLLAAGTVLGDGRNEKFQVTGLTPGTTYTIKVSGQTQSSIGEYFVGIKPLRTPTITSKVDDALPMSWGPDGSFTVPNPVANGWTNVTGAGYLNDHTVHTDNVNEAANNYAVWNIKATSATPEVFATWVPRPQNATNATYQVYRGATLLATVVVDQTQAPADALLFGTTLAKSLGAFSLTGWVPGTMLSVRLLTTGVNGDVVADGVFDPPTEDVTRLIAEPVVVAPVQILPSLPLIREIGAFASMPVLPPAQPTRSLDAVFAQTALPMSAARGRGETATPLTPGLSWGNAALFDLRPTLESPWWSPSSPSVTELSRPSSLLSPEESPEVPAESLEEEEGLPTETLDRLWAKFRVNENADVVVEDLEEDDEVVPEEAPASEE